MSRRQVTFTPDMTKKQHGSKASLKDGEIAFVLLDRYRRQVHQVMWNVAGISPQSVLADAAETDSLA
jgi:hypothetical protein